MTSQEHLLTIAAEECAEIALEASHLCQRLTKALRFGLNETQPGQEHSNLRRIVDGYEKLLQEGNDLRAVLALLQLVPSFDDCSRVGVDNDAVMEKQEKVQHFLAYSKECGTLTDDVVKEMRTMAMVAGQSSVEGPRSELKDLEEKFANQCSAWADRLDGVRQPEVTDDSLRIYAGPERWKCKRCGKERRRSQCLHCGNVEPLTDEPRVPGIVK